jgi:hypothetical protein
VKIKTKLKFPAKESAEYIERRRENRILGKYTYPFSPIISPIFYSIPIFVLFFVLNS